MILHFPRGVEVRITPRSVVTDEFRQQIWKAFHDYAEGTHPDYLNQDKLAFIDLIREENFKEDPAVIINEYIRGCLESDGAVELTDLVSLEQIENFMNVAVNRYRKGWHHWSGDHHLDEPACKFVAAAIEEVMAYGKEDHHE